MLSILKYLLLSLLSLPAMSQDYNEELIDWNADRRLTWADYKGDPNIKSGAAATTTTYLAIEYNVNKDVIRYQIQCRFSANRSWGIHKTDYILAHEQGHFDIAEIYARKLYKEMLEYRFNSRTYKKDLERIYNRVMQEKEDMQNAYDSETNHSIKKGKQAEWLEKIAVELEALVDYADYRQPVSAIVLR